MAINSLSASSYGLSGLVSGIDTESVVEKLLAGTQSKIDKALQKKTTLQNKQQLYRDVANQLKKLQESYLSFSSSTNLLSNAFYKTMKTNITTMSGSSPLFSVSASSSASTGNVKVDYIQQLATAYSQTSGFAATSDVKGTLSTEAATLLYNNYRGTDSHMNIKVGSQSIRVNNAPELFEGMSGVEIANYLNNRFDSAGMAAEAKFVNNKLSIVADNPDDYIVISGNEDGSNPTLATKMFGNSGTYSAQGTFSSFVNTDSYLPSIKVDVDGVQQDIYLSLSGLKEYIDGGDATNLMNDINTQLRSAFGNAVKIEGETDGGGNVIGFNFVANPSQTGVSTQKITITGGYQEMGALGLKSGISNKLSMNMSLRDLNSNIALEGNVHTFSINGVVFSYTANTSLATIFSDIENSKAGVRITYNEATDKFTIQNKLEGVDDDGIQMEQTEGNLLSALFGIDGGGAVTGFGVNKVLQGDTIDDALLEEFKYGGTFTFEVDGTNYKFTMPSKANAGTYTAAQFATAMDAAFKETFGVDASGNQIVRFTLENNSFSIQTNDPYKEIKIVAQNKDTNVSLLGFTRGDSTRATGSTATLADAGIDLTDGTITVNMGSYGSVDVDMTDLGGLGNDTTLTDLASIIQQKMRDQMLLVDSTLTSDQLAKLAQVSFDTKTASFRFASEDVLDAGGNVTLAAPAMEISVTSGAGSVKLDNLFGRDTLKLNQEYTTQAMTVSEGQNAIVSINGVEMERQSNTFTFNGLTFNLFGTSKGTVNDVTGEFEAAEDAASTIAVTRDTEQILEGIQEFIKLYNETMDMLYDLYKADPTYKDYAPLTDAQKAEMSDREIELWEEKSKEGLLRNDSALEKIITSMRNAMYTKPAGSSIAIYDLGIATSFYINDGNLQIEDLSKLTEMLEKDPDAIQKLFAGDGGIMELLNTSINNAVRSSSTNPGSLVSLAGSNALDSTSSIYKQIKEVDDQLETLELRYWKEYNRYWSQFNSMEQLIQQMNTQSSWLSQQLGY